MLGGSANLGESLGTVTQVKVAPATDGSAEGEFSGAGVEVGIWRERLGGVGDVARCSPVG